MQKKYIAGSFLWVTLLLAILVSCNPREVKKKYTFAKNDTIIPPAVIPAGKPDIHFTDTCPAPLNVNLSLKPPAIRKPADFFTTMQNFNTGQGLALSSIICGYRDKVGNLWFGTSGNGVSKYDGKTFTNYSSSHGLIHNLVNCITGDSEGNIWFGTYGGVSKYNGKYFENYTTAEGLVNNDAIKILEDKKGNIWISTSGGISRLSLEQKDTGQKKFINYIKENGLKSDFVGEILEDSKGNLWFVMDFGINKYDPAGEEKNGKAFVDYSRALGVENKAVYSITEDSKGMLWFSTTEGIICYDPAKEETGVKPFASYTTADGLVNNSVTCSAEDREGNLWFGTKEGVSRYSRTDASFLNFTTKQGLANNMVYSITEDKSGSIWFGTLGGGLCRYDGMAIVSYTEKQGLPGETVFSVAEDKSGDIWIGTKEGGITRYEFDKHGIKGGSFVNYTTTQGLPDNSVPAMAVDKKDNLWLGTKLGLSKFDGKSLLNYTTAQGLVNDNIVTITAGTKSNLWIGTLEGGVSIFDGRSFTNYTSSHGLIHNTVWSILEDKSGNMWFATRGGLSRFDGTSFVNFTTAQGLPDNNLSTVIEDKSGNILIGSWGGGVSVIRKDIAGRLTQAEAPEIKGTIFENFSTAEGLSNNVVYSILEDSAGNIIIGTNLGFTILKGGLDPSGKKTARDGIENYNQKNGYPINDINNNCSMFVDSHGIIWAGTSDKLVRFDYKSIHKSRESPNIFIQSVKVNNENISWYSLQRAKSKETVSPIHEGNIPTYIADELNVFGRKLTDNERDTMISKFGDIHFDSIRSFYSLPENLFLPYADNNISFDFVVIETARPQMVRYSYMLKGYNKNWSPVSDKTTAVFGNIREGSYTFMVKARSPEGIWSEPVNYSFTIRPPWYRSWPAYLFYAMFTVIVIILIDRYQRRRVVLKERQRAMKRELEQAREIEKAYTELKSTQAQLIQSEKMASLGELTAGIAHEIQNPLNFVNNFSEVSKELLDEMKTELDKGNSDDAKEIANDVIQNLEKINHHGKRADAIVKGMLQHSRSSSGIKEPTNINALADEYFRIAYHGLQAKDKSFRATMKMDFDQTIGKIDVIPEDIGKVILNLIQNAFYAVDEKKKQNPEGYEPTVTVTSEAVIPPTGGTRGVKISVKDNGNGIPQRIVDKIFQPFFTTKPTGQGTGLGLSLAYDIIKAHGGEIKVQTREGEGTEMIIKLLV